MPLAAEAEQGVAKGRSPHEVDGARQVRAHPGFRRGLRIGLRPEVETTKGPIPIGDDVLAWPLVGFDETQMKAVCFLDGLSQGPLEAVGIEPADNIDVSAHIVERIVPIEGLRGPNRELTGR